MQPRKFLGTGTEPFKCKRTSKKLQREKKAIKETKEKDNQQKETIMPSSTQIYHLLSTHSKQPMIKRILKNHPELHPLYEAWALNQHPLANAKTQERALLTALIDANIPSILQPLLSPIHSSTTLPSPKLKRHVCCYYCRKHGHLHRHCPEQKALDDFHDYDDPFDDAAWANITKEPVRNF
jgi:hypothetical protein